MTLQWLTEHSSAFNVFINLGILLIWGFYLNLLVGSVRRARRCKIMISTGGRAGRGTRCLVTNLSAEPVYVVRVLATVTTDAGRWCNTVTEIRRGEEEEAPPDPERVTRQGPLLTGHWRDIGSVSEVVEGAFETGGGGRLAGHESARLELFVIALYGSEDLPAGAYRTFTIRHEEGAWDVRPSAPDAVQIRGRRKRRQLMQQL